MSTTETTASQNETLVNHMQYLGMIPGPQQYYVQFLTSQAGFATSLGDLVDKIDNGTATRNDYLDVLVDLYAIGSSGVGFAYLLGYVSPLAFGVVVGIGVGLAVLEYADEHNYDISEMRDDLQLKLNTLKDWFLQGEHYLDQSINDFFNLAQNWVAPRVDPLVLDLDGDGIEALGLNATTHVVFDHNGDGLKTGTGWIAGDDGFLVLDRDGNGTIDNGGELFGDQTLVNGVKGFNGFGALLGEDSNNDFVFDANDSNFTAVRVWQDKNSDGISQTSELHTLTELGIASINLTSTATNTATNGNTQNATGTYMKTDGTTGEAGNLNFDQNSFYREFTDHLTLTDTALALPDMQGSGMVRDLREASTLSVGLTNTLQTMKDEGYVTHDTLMAQVDTLLAQWAGTSSMATSVNNLNFRNEKAVA